MPHHQLKKRSVLLDASSAILLVKADMLEFLISAYRVVVTPSVYRELCHEGYPGAQEISAFQHAGKITVAGSLHFPANGCPPPPTPASLGPGERDTILHFHNKSGEFIIIDDGRGARHCRDLGIPFINALLVPRILYFAGRLPEESYQATTEALIGVGRYSDTILAYACTCSRRDLTFFEPDPAVSSVGSPKQSLQKY